MITATMETPDRSHWIGTEYASGGKLSTEELYPVLIVTGLPRLVGPVEVKMRADRYVSSAGDWGSWRVSMNEVEPSNGIGEKTRAAIREACTPVVLAWLNSGMYVAARRKAIAETCVRLIRETYGRYGIDAMRAEVERHYPELLEAQKTPLSRAMDALAEAQRLLDDAPKN